jgi:hypothetical protein
MLVRLFLAISMLISDAQLFVKAQCDLASRLAFAAHTWLEEVGTRQGQHVYNATTVIGFSIDYTNLLP